MSSSARLPSLYIPHGGGPCFFMEPPPQAPTLWLKMEAYLRGLAAALPSRPRAVLVISAHWETDRPTLNIGARPELLFDYHGFPEHTYRLAYPAPGAPWLAERVTTLFAAHGLDVDYEAERGWDHGVFIPMMLIFPKADIPILQLSLQKDLDPERHLAMGRALASLRDEGVLILGSGMSYHNLRQLFSSAGAAASEQFDAWLTDAVADPQSRDKALARWSSAPGGRDCHPHAEHLLPLMVAAGAGAGEAGIRPYHDHLSGKAVSAFQFGGSSPPA